MKILFISPRSKTIVNFRGDLIKELINRGHEVVAIGPEEEFRKEINELGSKFIYLPMNKNSINIIHDFKYMFKLKSIIAVEKPDIVFAYTIKPIVYGTLASKMNSIKNIICMVEGLGSNFMERKSFKSKVIKFISSNLYKLAFSFAKKVFFLNKDDINDVLKLKLLEPNKIVHINGIGVNMDAFPISPLPKEPIFILITRLIREKGVLEYCRAAEIAKRTCPQARFQILGPFDTKPGSITKKEIQKFIDNGSIEYLGSTNSVIPYIRNASVFVLPTYYREGLPRSIMEAMSMGRAIITTDAPGCKETVIEDENGFIVPQKDHNILSEKMIYLAEDENLRAKMGKNSFKLCEHKFEVSKINNTIIKELGLS